MKVTIREITLIGIMVAVIEVCKMTLSFLPNIELTSFWLILFTLYFGWRILYVIPVFILLEGALYGVGLWWIMYLYIWPLLVLATMFFSKQKSVWFWSIFSGFFGLIFGFLCSFPYVVIGTTSHGILGGLHAAFVWWVAGIPWDIVHCIGNFVLMRVLYTPMQNIMKRLSFFSKQL